VVGGAVTAITIVDPGFGYTSVPAITIGAPTGDSPTQATATAVTGGAANPVAVALTAVANRLRAVTLVDGPGSTYAAAVTYRNDFGSMRTMVIDPGVLEWDINTSQYVAAPASAYAAGLQSRIDREHGFWHSFSNYPIENIGGPARPVDWMPNDPNTEANQLNANEVTTIIHDDGFRFWGLRSTSADSLWAFLSVRRTADMIYESIEHAHRVFLGKPFSLQLLEDIQNSVNAYLRLMRDRGALIGGECWISPDANTPTSFANGELTVDFDLEPPAPLEHLMFRARRNPQYYQDFIEEFSRRVS
jgi:phage tail sheath protein FI